MEGESHSIDTVELNRWVSRHRLFVATVGHLALFTLSWLLAFGLAYNFRKFDDWFSPFFLNLLPIVLLVKAGIFAVMGLHRGSWRYVSMRDVWQIARAAFLSFVWIFVIYYSLVNAEFVLRRLGVEGFTYEPFGGRDFPDSVLLIDFAGTQSR